MRLALLPTLLLAGCVGEGGDPLASPVRVDCPIGGVETFTAEPVLRLGHGYDGYEAFDDFTIPIVFGAGNAGSCGYHVDLAFETEQLCPVVELEYEIHLIGIDGGPIYDAFRRMMFVREDDRSSVQSIWAMSAPIPERYHPNDPEHADVCPNQQELPCDESRFLLQATATDLTGRSASAELMLDPVCCD